MTDAYALSNKLPSTSEKANKKISSSKCIELLMTKVYKHLNGFSREILNTIFKLRQNTISR